MNILKMIRNRFAGKVESTPHTPSLAAKAEQLIAASFNTEPEKWFTTLNTRQLVVQNRERGVSLLVSLEPGAYGALVPMTARCGEFELSREFVDRTGEAMITAHRARAVEAKAVRSAQIAQQVVDAMERKL